MCVGGVPRDRATARPRAARGMAEAAPDMGAAEVLALRARLREAEARGEEADEADMDAYEALAYRWKDAAMAGPTVRASRVRAWVADRSRCSDAALERYDAKVKASGQDAPVGLLAALNNAKAARKARVSAAIKEQLAASAPSPSAKRRKTRREGGAGRALGLDDLDALEAAARSRRRASAGLATKAEGSDEEEEEVFDETDEGEEDDDDAEVRQAREATNTVMSKVGRISRNLRKLVGAAAAGEAGQSGEAADADASVGDATAGLSSREFDGRRLKDYQVVGINWLMLVREQGLSAVLADEMGLGKTAQSCVFLQLLHEQAQARAEGPGEEPVSLKHLVVAPGSVLDNWARELAVWAPSLRVALYHGTEREALREELASGERDFDVLLTSYSYFERDSEAQRRDQSLLRSFKFEYLLLDEAHALKDATSSRFTKLMRIRAARRLLLTGTPLQNKLQELLCLLQFLMPDMFDSRSAELANLFAVETEGDAGVIKKVKALLTPFLLRRTKDAVLTSMVPKTELLKRVTLIDEQQQAYDGIIEVARAAREAGGERRDNSLFTALRRAANHPLLMRRHFADAQLPELAAQLHAREAFGPEASEARILAELREMSDFALSSVCAQHAALRSKCVPTEALFDSAKARALRDLLPRLKAEGHRVLLFSQWTQMLDVLGAITDELGLKVLRLDGNTPVDERQALVDSFNKDESIFGFLLSTRAGGLGLNLAGADTVVLHDLDFNPSVDRQAVDRAHRMTQTKPVTVYKFVAEGTVDEAIFDIATRKAKLDAAVLDRDDAQAGAAKDADERGSIKAILAGILGQGDQSDEESEEESGEEEQADGEQADDGQDSDANEEVGVEDGSDGDADAADTDNDDVAMAAGDNESEPESEDSSDDEEDGPVTEQKVVDAVRASLSAMSDDKLETTGMKSLKAEVAGLLKCDVAELKSFKDAIRAAFEDFFNIHLTQTQQQTASQE